MKQFMIIDGSSLLYRAFFALPPLTNAQGLPTNAVYGFLTMLLKLLEEGKPDYIAVSFDKGRDTFRTELYSDYKANRESAPDDFRPQFSLIKEVLEVLGIHPIEMDRFEGDDIIGSMAKQKGNEDMQISIVTGDRDILQLIDTYSTVLLTKKGISEMIRVTPDNMKDLYGYSPSQVVDMKALMGDASDNIPGVPGVGEKTALKLITAYGDLDGVYDSIELIKGKLKEKLIDNKDKAYLSRELASIKTDLSVEPQNEYFCPQLSVTEMRELFERLGFHRLIPRFLDVFGSPMQELDQVPVEVESFYTTHIDMLPSIEDVADKEISVFLRTKGRIPFLEIDALYLFTGSKLFINEHPTFAIDELLAVLNSAHQVISMQGKELYHVTGKKSPGNLKYLKDEDIRLFDFSLVAYLLDPTRANYGINYLCERFQTSLIHGTTDGEEGAQIAIALYRLAHNAILAMEENKLFELYKNIELPLIRTLVVLEKNGIFVDVNRLNAMKHSFNDEIDALRRTIYEMAGEEFNINSPKQLGDILFTKLHLTTGKKTKTGYSTNAEVLEFLSKEHPIVENILAYRTVSKLVTTYLEGMEGLINPITKRIHSTFNQTVTATGRLSSSDPNLQNIPVRTEKGKAIRSLFLPGPTYDMLVSADYSQIELRILAHLSEDDSLIEAFAKGLDIHRFTAAEVLGKSPEEVTSIERSHAKAVNFGIIYGISDFGLSRDLGIGIGDAKEYIETYFSRYPTIKGFMDSLINEGRTTGAVRTMFGRVRSLPDILSKNFNRRSFAERAAMNTPIQGSAADIMKMAMNRVENRLEKEGLQARLLLQVHDELVLEVMNSEKAAVETLLKEEMENVVSLRVPLIVDINSASNWAAIK